MATQTLLNKQSSLPANLVPRNRIRFFLILLTIAAIIIAAASGTYLLHKRFNSLHQEVMKMKLLFSQYQQHKHKIEDSRISRLEITLANNEAKLFNQGGLIKRLEHIIEHQLPHSDVPEINILKELKVHKDMYFQAQQKIHAYEQELNIVSQELRDYKEQNHLIKQDQAKMKAEYQELSKKVNQISQDAASQDTLEARLSQLVYVDYEHEEKLKDLKKAVETCAKIGELKVLESYYDDKLTGLSNVIQDSKENRSLESQNLDKNLQKLSEENEQIKMAFNKLAEFQKRNEQRLNNLEKQKVDANQRDKRKTPPKREFTNPNQSRNSRKEQRKEDGFEKEQNRPENYLEDDFQSLVHIFVRLIDNL